VSTDPVGPTDVISEPSSTAPGSAASGPASGLDALRTAIYRLSVAQRRLTWRQKQASDVLSSAARFRALVLLMSVGEATNAQLAREAGLKPNTVSVLLGQMEAQGYVKRRCDPHDGRLLWTSLTRKGKAQVVRRHVRWRTQLAEALSEFSDDDLVVASEVLEQVASLFHRIVSPGDDLFTEVVAKGTILPPFDTPVSGKPGFERIQGAVYLLALTDRRLTWHFKSIGDPVSSSGRQKVLLVLLTNREATAARLSRETNLKPNSMSVLLAQLEGQGVVQRRDDPSDRRTSLVSLTRKGRAEARKADSEWRQRYAETFASTPPSALVTASLVLDRFAELLGAEDERGEPFA